MDMARHCTLVDSKVAIEFIGTLATSVAWFRTNAAPHTRQPSRSRASEANAPCVLIVSRRGRAPQLVPRANVGAPPATPDSMPLFTPSWELFSSGSLRECRQCFEQPSLAILPHRHGRGCPQ